MEVPEQIACAPVMLNVGAGREMLTIAGIHPLAKPTAQLFAGRILMAPSSPFAKSDATVTLLPPGIQLLPLETAAPIDQPLGNWYS